MRIKKIHLFFIRLVLLSLLLLLISGIKYKIPSKNVKPTVAVLIDTSYSMKFNDRFTKVKKFLDTYLNKLNKETNLIIYKFNIFPEKVNDVKTINISHQKTVIHSSIEKVLLTEKDIDSILLLSDGKNINSELPVINGNINIIPIIFQEPKIKDVSIINVRHSRIGFKDVDYTIGIEILCSGYQNTLCKIALVDINTKNIVTSKDLILKEGKNEVKLSFVPKEIGQFRYKVALQKYKDELTYENNEFNFNLEIKKNKIRILYLCGQPSPEYYFLRNLLKNDPNIDLVSFVILRNPENPLIVPDEESALIPFPTHEIFVKELYSYDILIFENFTFRRFHIPMEYLENIARFVSKGGGFIMIGGNNSFFLGGYKFTPIEEILPVKILETEKFVIKDIVPYIPDTNNKILKILDDRERNKSLWYSIPPVGNYQKIYTKPESTNLMFVPESMKEKEPIPLMAYWEKGKGRVFVSGTNTTWRWILGNVYSEKYDFKQLYTQLWKNVIYWCGNMEDFKDIYIIPEETSYQVNDTIRLKVIFSKKSQYSPEMFVTMPDLYRKKISLSRISDTEYRAEFISRLSGKYIFTVVLREPGQKIVENKELFVELFSGANFNEIADLTLDIDYLSKLAGITNNVPVFETEFNVEKFISQIKSKIVPQYLHIIELNRFLGFGILFILLFILEIFFARYKKYVK